MHLQALSASPALPDARPSILRQIDRAIGIAQARIDALADPVADIQPDTELVRRAGGRRLAEAKAALVEARSAESAVLARASRWPRWVTALPLARGILSLPDTVKAEGVTRDAQATFDAELTKARERAASYLREKARSERDALRRKLGVATSRFRAIKARLETHPLPMQTPVADPLTPAWLAEIERSLAIPVPRAVEKVTFRVLAGHSPARLAADRELLVPSLRSRAFAFPHEHRRGPVPSDGRWTVSRTSRFPAGIAGIRLAGVPDLPAPEGILSPRVRASLPILAKGYNRPERFYLPVPGDGPVARAAVGAGARIGKKGGVHVDLTVVDAGGAVSPFLPFVGKRLYAPLPADLIPSSSWGANLSNLLTSACWGRIRKTVTSPFGGQCQVCGELRQGQAIECHEVWDYEGPGEGADMRVQRLAGILSVCRPCHRMFHIGFGEAAGKVEESVVRLADVNGWTMRETHLYLDWVQACWEIRSEWSWNLDLSLLEGETLVVDARKWRVNGDGTLERVGIADVAAPTRIHGVSWRLGPEGELRR